MPPPVHPSAIVAKAAPSRLRTSLQAIHLQQALRHHLRRLRVHKKSVSNSAELGKFSHPRNQVRSRNEQCDWRTSEYRSAHRAMHCCSLLPRLVLGFVTHFSAEDADECSQALLVCRFDCSARDEGVALMLQNPDDDCLMRILQHLYGANRLSSPHTLWQRLHHYSPKHLSLTVCRHADMTSDGLSCTVSSGACARHMQPHGQSCMHAQDRRTW